MNIIICLDDNNGISFNNRRQSRDKKLISRILKLTSGKPLRMNQYSSKIFCDNNILISNDFLLIADTEDYCFCEDDSFVLYKNKIEKLIVYKWNKIYPSDIKIDLSFFADKKLTHTTDFTGNSHDIITEEIYE
ncbi:MAG: ribonuclease Z [Acutalibacteraceae bacterium]|nr:ribonuclease Z [Acutalibacteraceae bacterium]